MGSNLSTIKKNNNGSLIFILDDRSDMILSSEIYLRSISQPFLSAQQIDSAKVLFEEYYNWIRVAFIDNKLEGASGLEFIIEMKNKYPQIKFVLLTAFDLDLTEKEIIKENQIILRDKSKFLPIEFQEFLGSANHSEELEEKRNNAENKKKADLAQEILEVRLSKDTLKQNWEQYTKSLVKQIRYTAKSQDEYYFYDGNNYSTEDIIKQINEQTTLGLEFVQIHSEIVDYLLNKQNKRKGWSRWLINLIKG